MKYTMGTYNTAGEMDIPAGQIPFYSRACTERQLTALILSTITDWPAH